MPDLVLILTDRHNADTVLALLPKGCVYVGMSLTQTEWNGTDAARIGAQVLAPMYAEAKRRWPEVRPI